MSLLGETSPRTRLLAGVGLLLGIWLVWRFWPDEARRVEAKVKEAADAVEREDLFDLAGCLSRNYADASGREYQDILGAAKGLVFDRFEDIEISFRSCQVTVTGTLASAAISVQARGKPNGASRIDALFDDRDVFDFHVGLKKESDGWRIVRIDEAETP